MTTHTSSPSAATSRTGRRKQNEDAFGLAPQLGLYVVCDGMGGYQGGDIASQTAVEQIERFFAQNLGDEEMTWPYGIDAELSYLENLADAATRLAHDAIVAKRQGPIHEMGSTLAMIATDHQRELVVAHLGDSRVYRLRAGQLVQLTDDHSLYNSLVDAGALRDEQGNITPLAEFAYGNVITRALGVQQEKDPRPTLRSIRPLPGDVYLLCSDGLHGVLDDKQIKAHLQQASPQQACERLVEEAFMAGSQDNITALVLHYTPRNAQAKHEEEE